MKKYTIFFLLLFIVGTGSLVWLYITNSSASEAAETVATETELPHTELSTLPDIVEIKSEGKSIKLSLNDIPQYKNYLLNEADIQSEIARTQFTSLDVPSSETYAILKYGCGTKDCSTILVKTDGSKSESLTMPVGIFQDYKLSPDQGKMLIRYAYDEGGLVRRQILVAVDLKPLKVIPYTSADLEEPFMLKPTWPIISYDWNDNNEFTIETAALETSEYSALKDWFSSENRKTRKVTIRLDSIRRLDEYPKAT
ncbi:hypothetical protein JNUCC31_19940 [Paenibacillus sp. JNUCC31]|uniref:hypothetical protein n=1 Tax=Paenibacillus sp. JNUCC-31 TaxID=2777983 RepID=UPI001783DE4D|nr:hypothetical protein [Paenibacillus sp. JNUCC-31]QOS77078.1 hypothetical protein JNUCC31_19940 [Paenibacillus sp. JNUCC-31]